MAISFGSSISGINAAMQRQEVSAHNIANINTPGYGQYNAYQTDMAPQGTRISHVSRTPAPDNTISTTDLAKEAVEQKNDKNSLSANLKVMKVKDNMLESVLDIFA
jgi:flagellar basal body rod protein FlgB